MVPGQISDAVVIECVKWLLRDSTGPSYVQSRDVAEFLKAKSSGYRRYKTCRLIPLIEPNLCKNIHVAKEQLGLQPQTKLNDITLVHHSPDDAKTLPIDDVDLQNTDAPYPSQKEGSMPSVKRRSRVFDAVTQEDKRICPDTKDAVPWCSSPKPTVTLDMLGGIDKTKAILKELVLQPLNHSKLYDHLGARPINGILLYGPSGSGKTQLALALAEAANVPFFHVSGPEIITGITGDSEKKLRAVFESAKKAQPSLIFIDELDTICFRKDSAEKNMERRLVAQLGLCMDQIANSFVIVVGATNRIETIDLSVRRNGRFDREIPVTLPDESGREHILTLLAHQYKISSDVDFKRLARRTPGFVGADLQAILKEAALIRIHRYVCSLPEHQRLDNSAEPHTNLTLEMVDLIHALDVVQPSAQREGFATIPDLTWDDVGGLTNQRLELEDLICNPIRDFELYQSLGLHIPAGILLYGPPGCGKTLLAKTVAAESGANFISVNGPELLNKFVGESERSVRQVFQRARLSAPCIIFFDELDSLCVCRGSSGVNSASERVTNQLLTEMDGVHERRNVYVIAATNRPDLIDPAMLRPGRLERLLTIPLPDQSGREDILRRLSAKMAFDHPTLDLAQIASLTPRFSGADLHALLRKAVLIALKDHRSEVVATTTTSPKIQANSTHVMAALRCIRPSVTEDHAQHYETLAAQFQVFPL